MASVSLRGVTRRFDRTTAVDGLTLDIADGEFFVLLGPSGAGKTTTLRLIAGLERPDAGQVLIAGQDLTAAYPAERDCAFVFQQYSLYPHLSVYDNLAFPLRAPMRKTHEPAIRRRVEGGVAALLHIENKLQRKPIALSGGEMQRVAIGRALVRQPAVFLMDEPLSSLDARLREELRVELKRIQRSTGATVLYVTHDQVEATTLADRIGLLEHGRLQQVGTPQQVYEQPATLPVAQRLGNPAINVLPARWFNTPLPAGTTQVGIRPEDVALAEGGGGIACTVVECSLLKHQLVAERDGVELRARLLMQHPVAPGSALHFHLPPERCLYFDAKQQRIAA